MMHGALYRDTEVSRRNESWQDEVGRDALSQGKPIFGKTYGSSVVRQRVHGRTNEQTKQKHLCFTFDNTCGWTMSRDLLFSYLDQFYSSRANPDRFFPPRFEIYTIVSTNSNYFSVHFFRFVQYTQTHIYIYNMYIHISVACHNHLDEVYRETIRYPDERYPCAQIFY